MISIYSGLLFLGPDRLTSKELTWFLQEQWFWSGYSWPALFSRRNNIKNIKMKKAVWKKLVMVP